MTVQDFQSLLHLLGGNHHAHANAHIKGVEHIPFRDVAGLGDEVKDGQHPHGTSVDLGAEALRDAAGDVLIEAAAGNVADALDIHLFKQSQNALDVDSGGGQQGFQNGLTTQGLTGLLEVGVVLHVKDLPYQAKAVGMHTGGSQGDHHVTGFHAGIVNDFLLVHNAHTKARQIVIIHRHHAGMLGSLAADQRGTGLDAALGHAAYDFRNALGHIFAAGDVVQEEQGPGAAADHIVDAHGNTVNADGVVLI